MLAHKWMAEGIGTFFLVLTVLVVSSDPGGAGALGPIVVGATLAGMIYALGHVSAAHFNPVVTFAFRTQRAASPREIAGYLGAQVVAALVAVWVARVLHPAARPVLKDYSLLEGFIGETLGTFALVLVILHVAIARGTKGNGFYGFAIAATVVGGAYTFGEASGAYFNPAVLLGSWARGAIPASDLPALLGGQTLGAAAASAVFFLYERRVARG